jgi:hypothetical protein
MHAPWTIVCGLARLCAFNASAQTRRAPFIPLKSDTDDAIRLAESIGQRRSL